jgi:aryl-alcohol dehydrogenase-like predicted oxidoreductase
MPEHMEHRTLGAQGLSVGAIGLGCMGMSTAYGTPDDQESIATIHRALDRGVTMLDTAETYGPFTNEILVGKAIKGRRSDVVIATKFGFRHGPEGRTGLDGTPVNATRVADQSLSRLGIDVIDLYYLHRKDPNVPIEDTVGAMRRLVEAGKVRFLGLSEVGPETLRRAHAVHPISALQSEYSIWERGIEGDVIPTLRELKIGLVPFSPLGRGFLAGTVTSAAGLPADDFRHNLPRFDVANAEKNATLVEVVKSVAARHQATPAQVALAWVLAQGHDIVPIPGTKRRTYLDENLDALDIKLSAGDLKQLDDLAAKVAGDRYNQQMAKTVER